jgi:hypothetical protein
MSVLGRVRILPGTPRPLAPTLESEIAENSDFLVPFTLTSMGRGGTQPHNLSPYSARTSSRHLDPAGASVIRVKRPFRGVGMARVKAPNNRLPPWG